MIKAFIGPVRSGKSTFLEAEASWYEQQKKKVLRVRSDKDNIDERHDGVVKKGIKAKQLCDINVIGYDVISIDEGQFFSDINKIIEWADIGKIVLVSLIFSTFEQKAWPGLDEILANCEHIKQLKAVCNYCTKTAYFSHRLSKEKEVEVVGSKNYVPICRDCKINLFSF